MKVSDEDIECIRRLTRRLDGGTSGQQVRRGYEGTFNDIHRELLLLRMVADAAVRLLSVGFNAPEKQQHEADELDLALKEAGR